MIGVIYENICIYQDSTLNLKRKSISIEKDTIVSFYIAHDNEENISI